MILVPSFSDSPLSSLNRDDSVIILYTFIMERGIFILGNQGLGDQIVLNGLYRYFAKRYDYVIVPIADRYEKTIREMTADVENILVSGYRMEIWEPHMLAHKNYLEKRSFRCLSLGEFGSNYLLNKKLSLDQTIYAQAGVPHEIRWSDFKYERNIMREKQLFAKLGCEKGEYVFVHDDSKRNFIVDSKFLPKNVSVVRPKIGLRGFSFFDYIYTLENAAEIHCIESSFAVLVEQLDLEVPKFAHRYGRPDVLVNPRLHYTFKSDWRIILGA